MMLRRQKKQYVFAALLGVIALVNGLFFLILLHPARSEYLNLKDSISRLRSEVAARHVSISRLEKRNAELDRFEQDRRQMFTTHFMPRDVGFVKILPALTTMGDTAGVRNFHKDFGLETIPQYSLYSVKIKIPVQGPYSSVVKFIKEVETSDIFLLINGIDVRSQESRSSGGSALALSLDLETFFYQ